MPKAIHTKFKIKASKSARIVLGGLFSLIGITALSAAVLVNTTGGEYNGLRKASALDGSTVSTASVTVPDACNLAATIPEDKPHSFTMNGGTYEADAAETILSVVCNDRNGYSVYAVGYGNNTEGNSNLTGAPTGLTIPTGLVTDTSVSNWSFKLAALDGTFKPTILSDNEGYFTNYHKIPSANTKVITYANDIDVSSSSQVKAIYAVALTSTQAADTYTGQVKYTVVHPNYTNVDGSTETYNVPVTFAGEGVSTVTFAASGYDTQTISTSGGTANLTAGVQYTVTMAFTSNHEFSDWSLNNSNYGTLSSTTTNPAYFTPNANSVSAIITAIGKSSKLWFQNATSADCGKTMYDNRGTDAYKNIAYTTKKIGSLCWMTRNLDLPGGTALSSSDTNLVTDFTLPASSTSGFSNYNTDYVYNSNSTSCGDGSPCYSYYSFYTATAHWGTNSVSSGSSNVDICPKGWRLPTQSEYSTLVNSYNTGAQLVSNWSAVYSGGYYNSSLGNGGSLGSYHSSTVYNANASYTLYLLNSNANANGAHLIAKYGGLAIRCVAKS